MPATSRIDASLIEVFSSIQGEGLLIGCRQVFARFADCNLSCAYCDTPFRVGPQYRLETAPGSGDSLQIENPADLITLGTVLRDWQNRYPGLHHSLSLTGGEPLLQADALQRWLPIVSRIWPVYLETNGTLPSELAKILPWTKWVSMDLKTEDSTGQPTRWDAHTEFIRVAQDRLCQIKLIVGKETRLEDVRRAARFVGTSAAGVPLILQPCTVNGEVSVDGDSLLEIQAAAAAEHADTRLIPQVHSFLRIA